MGCGTSKPEVKEAPKHAPTGASKRPAKPAEKILDPHLQGTYELQYKLGRGGTGETWACTRSEQPGREDAVKFIQRPIPGPLLPQIQREIEIQAELGEGHVNIIKAKEVILTESHLALVLEKADRGSLTKYVSSQWKNAQTTGLFLSEDEARYIFRQFIEAVEYCHSKNVAHRDLKLDNTLLDGSNPPLIKLCDFGFARTIGKDGNAYTHLGTPCYMSPELLNSQNKTLPYDAKSVDVWASGITLIVMLMGTFPFDHEVLDPNSPQAQYEVWMKQIGGDWEEIPAIASSIGKLSPECRDLLNQIFKVDSRERITIEGVKAHPWYTTPLSRERQAGENARNQQQEDILERQFKKRFSKELENRRRDRLEALVAKAGTRHEPVPGVPYQLERIPLTDESIMQPTSIIDIGLPDVNVAEGEPGEEDSSVHGSRHGNGLAKAELMKAAAM